MKTVGAKEFRLHLNEMFDRVLKGEDIVVQHRFKGPVRISAVQQDQTKRQALAGLRAFDEAPKKPSPFDKHKSVKELYHESISRKYAK